MKLGLLLCLMALLSGCMSAPKKKHATIHDYCVKHLDHYASYDECYSEVKADRQRAHARARADAENEAELIQGLSNAGQTMGDSMRRPYIPPATTTCNSVAGSTTCTTE